MAVLADLKDEVLTIYVDGKLNAVTSLELHDRLMEYMPKAKRLIFDFKDLDYISSGGLRELLIAYEDMSAKDGMLIRNVSQDVAEVLDITGFSTIFDIE